MRVEEIYAINCIDSIKEWVKNHPEDLYDLYEDIKWVYTILGNLKRNGQGLQHIYRSGSMCNYVRLIASRGITHQAEAISSIGGAAGEDEALVEQVMAVVDNAHLELLDPVCALTPCGPYVGTVAVYMGEKGLNAVLKRAGIKKGFNRH